MIMKLVKEIEYKIKKHRIQFLSVELFLHTGHQTGSSSYSFDMER